MLSGAAHSGGTGAAPEWKFFLVPSSDCTIRDTWFTAGMRATGSKTIVTGNASVPSGLVLKLNDLRDGRTPGSTMYRDAIFHTPYSYYAPIAVATPMLGAAQGAYEHFREWTRTRNAQDGSSVAAKTSVQVGMARAAADLDAADLLLRRAVNVTNVPQAYSPKHLTRSLRDFARVSELTVSVIDTLLSLSGTAAFNTAHPLQRAWRDIHFMSMHSAVNAEKNFAPFRPRGVRPRSRRLIAVSVTDCVSLICHRISANKNPGTFARGFVSQRCTDDQAAVSAAAFRLLRQKSRPARPRPVAKSGSAAGTGVAET